MNFSRTHHPQYSLEHFPFRYERHPAQTKQSRIGWALLWPTRVHILPLADLFLPVLLLQFACPCLASLNVSVLAQKLLPPSQVNEKGLPLSVFSDDELDNEDLQPCGVTVVGGDAVANGRSRAGVVRLRDMGMLVQGVLQGSVPGVVCDWLQMLVDKWDVLHTLQPLQQVFVHGRDDTERGVEAWKPGYFAMMPRSHAYLRLTVPGLRWPLCWWLWHTPSCIQAEARSQQEVQQQRNP